MRATIWARRFTLPPGFCYNCNAPTTTSVPVRSEGGIASSVQHGHGLLVAAISAAATSSGAPHQVPYCTRCAVTAYKKPLGGVAGTRTLGLLLVVLGFGAIGAVTDGADRIASLIAALAGLAGLVAWVRYVRRPLAPGQTTRWRAFAVLNEGKDLLHSHRAFVRIEYSNPRVVEEIRRLNPGVEMTLEGAGMVATIAKLIFAIAGLLLLVEGVLSVWRSQVLNTSAIITAFVFLILAVALRPRHRPVPPLGPGA